ncbi:hypothetical protein G8O29_07595 [Rhodobacter sp. M37P]|uniref:YD repeat-containing protein n=2 Tax=Rhodobacter calidifons TaxID=2715277 RepID=A0ABX0G6U8_9RHOB|nr:hypothetical protein [Rhodobacter calidifons]
MRTIAILACLTVPAAPALAASWTVPEGCEAFMTVQSKACRVSHHYRCSADAPGDQWRVDMDQEGPFFYSRINHEAEWVESYDPIMQVLDPDPADPASMTELIGEGMDTWSFSLSKADGSGSRAEGYDRLTGRSVVIDGITLSETEVEFAEYDRSGKLIRRSRGNEYMHSDWRLFFAGPGETDLGDGIWRPIDGSPVEFIFPGEEGFLARQPKYDCDALTARAPATILPATLPVTEKE